MAQNFWLVCCGFEFSQQIDNFFGRSKICHPKIFHPPNFRKHWFWQKFGKNPDKLFFGSTLEINQFEPQIINGTINLSCHGASKFKLYGSEDFSLNRKLGRLLLKANTFPVFHSWKRPSLKLIEDTYVIVNNIFLS